jgi:hypothetical protein
MTAKKNAATKLKSVRAKKSRPSTAAKNETFSAEASTPTELVPSQAAVTPKSTAPEPSLVVTPCPAEEETIVPALARPNSSEPRKKLSALDAAAQVLAETGRAMSCPELIMEMAAKGYWSSPKGRTPAGTLYSALLRELQTKGDRARFCKTGRGKFALRPTV